MGIFNEVIDITHHSKRTQAGNLEAAGVLKSASNDSGKVISTSVPQNVTVEKAIEYFKANATGEYTNLYTATAQWLEKFNSYSRTIINKATENIPSVDISEVSEDE